jgi:hypothetical protein
MSHGYTMACILTSIDKQHEYVTNMVDCRVSELPQLVYQIFLSDATNWMAAQQGHQKMTKQSERYCAVSQGRFMGGGDRKYPGY